MKRKSVDDATTSTLRGGSTYASGEMRCRVRRALSIALARNGVQFTSPFLTAFMTHSAKAKTIEAVMAWTGQKRFASSDLHILEEAKAILAKKVQAHIAALESMGYLAICYTGARTGRCHTEQRS